MNNNFLSIVEAFNYGKFHREIKRASGIQVDSVEDGFKLAKEMAADFKNDSIMEQEAALNGGKIGGIEVSNVRMIAEVVTFHDTVTRDGIIPQSCETHRVEL